MTTASLSSLVVAYVGNFGPPHSTENHVAMAFEHHGATVLRLQENDERTWAMLPFLRVDLVVWTKTWSLPDLPQLEVLDRLADHGTPVVGFHLDRWWGLDRETQITGGDDHAPEPYFAVPLLITADGGHQQRWADVGIVHRWLPPAVSLSEAQHLGHRRSQYVTPLAFVGSWEHYHREWQHRRQLVSWAQARYGRSFGIWPKPGRGPVRGADLADLYQSVGVLLGDSCLAGGATHYWSDRIPETLGRGGFLVHPWVDGLDEHFGPEHLATWPLGDFDALGRTIDHYLTHLEEARDIARAGREHVLEHHTYERRVEQIVSIAQQEDLLA